MRLHRRPAPQFALVFFVPALTLGGLLLFFVLLGRTFLLQPGVAVSLPSSPFLVAPQRDPYVVAITAAPVPTIFFDDRGMSAEELDAALDAARPVARSVIIRADQNAPVELVVRVFEIANARGLDVVLATTEPGGNEPEPVGAAETP